MSVHLFPGTRAEDAYLPPTVPSTDATTELLRRTVVAYRKAQLSGPATVSHIRHMDVAATFLTAVEILTGKEGVAAEVSSYLHRNIFDLVILTRVVHSFRTPPAA